MLFSEEELKTFQDNAIKLTQSYSELCELARQYILNGDQRLVQLLFPKSPLTSDLFQYEGMALLPTNASGSAQSIGMVGYGLTYRPSTNTFFMTGIKKGDGVRDDAAFNLYEVELHQAPTLAECRKTPPKIVRDWGPLNPSPYTTLPMGERTIPKMEGLYWDESHERLYFTYGNFYNPRQSNDPVLGYVTFENDHVNIYGPWTVKPNIHSERTKGCLWEMPKELQDLTGHRWGMFGIRGSTSQLQSWGTGLCSVAEPTQPNEVLDGKLIIYWALKAKAYENGHTHAWSDFPRNNNYKIVLGNDDCGGLVHPTSYENNVLLDTPEVGQYQQFDMVKHCSYLKVNNFEGLIYFGTLGAGWGWYGNENAHRDPSVKGMVYNNNLNSLAYSGQCRSPQSPDKGTHAELYKGYWWIVQMEDILESVRGNRDSQVGYHSCGEVASLGGAPILPPVNMKPDFGDHYWDRENQRLWVVSHNVNQGDSIVNIWKVG